MSSYTSVGNHNLGGYVPSCYNLIRTTLPKCEKKNIGKLLAHIKSKWEAKGVFIVLMLGVIRIEDHWLILWFLVKLAKLMFIEDVDWYVSVKDKEFIASFS